MKKIIAIVTIGASTAFLQVQAQEISAPASSSQDTAQPTPSVPSSDEEKVEIEQSEIPKEVMDSFEKSEYNGMDIITAYEVNPVDRADTAQYQSTSSGSSSEYQDTIPGGNSQTTTQSVDSASSSLEQAAQQTEQAVDQAATGMEQNPENVAESSDEAATRVDQDVQENASEFAQDTEQAASDVGREVEEDINNEAARAEGLIEDPSQAVGDTTINEANGGDQMKEDPTSSSSQARQSVDSASLGINRQDDETVVEMSEDVAKQTEGPITEMESTEEIEDTGRVLSAEAPESVDSADTRDIAIQPATAEDDSQRARGKELYENNQYDNYTEANSNGYQEIAQEQAEDKQGKQYELEVKSEDGSVTLTYDENGELVKTNKGSM